MSSYQLVCLFVTDRIAWKLNEESGFQSKELIVKANLRLGDVDQYPNIDVTIDGADEVDETLNCIKGGGACHLREKVLAEAADTFILVADYRKNSDVLGKNVRPFCLVFPIPCALSLAPCLLPCHFHSHCGLAGTLSESVPISPLPM